MTMDDTHDLDNRPRPPAPATNGGALHAPWTIQYDEDHGITVFDSRGLLIWFVDFDIISIRRREEIRAQISEAVAAVNERADLKRRLAEAREINADMLAALDRLTREVAGCWGMDESSLRVTIGNTNYNIVVERIEAASAAIAKATGASKMGEQAKDTTLSAAELRASIEANKPRPYDLSDPNELLRLYRETHGYLKICHHKHGTDWEGRRFAIDAMAALAKAGASP